MSNKKAHQLDPLETIPGTQLILAADPETGKLYRTTVDALLAKNAPYQVFAGEGTFVIPDRTNLHKIYVDPATDCTLKIGSAVGLEDLMAETAVLVANPDNMFILNLSAKAGVRTIYLGGLTADCKIYFFKESLAI